jgi:hypothetical protein
MRGVIMSNLTRIQKMARMELKELNALNHELVLDKMRLDKFFSDFLHENVLDHDLPDTKEWILYKTKLSEYEELGSLIGWSKYYIERFYEKS